MMLKDWRAPDFDLRVEKSGSRLACDGGRSPASRSMHMKTRDAVIAPNDDCLEKTHRCDAARSTPQAGDILVSERSARADVFAISIVPSDSDLTLRRYSAAIERVQ